MFTQWDIIGYRIERLFGWVSLIIAFACVALAPLFDSFGATWIRVVGMSAWALMLIAWFITYPPPDSKIAAKGARKKIRRWKKITGLSLRFLPRDEAEANAVALRLGEILEDKARRTNDAFAKRDQLKQKYESFAACTGDSLSDILAKRPQRRASYAAFRAANAEADKIHHEFLTAWDYFVKDDPPNLGYFAHLKGGPAVWRERVSKKPTKKYAIGL